MKIDLNHLKNSRQGIWLLIDFLMLGLLILNLLLIIIDALFATAVVSNLLEHQTPGLFVMVDSLHQNFLLIDLIFVFIFLSEFVLRWGVAIREKIYDRWFFYPFIHWYDLLGCIPLGSARILRFLRIISIIYRLHHYRIVDFTSTRTYQFLAFYYNVLLEELSDRIVAKVLTGIQQDLQEDTQFGSKFLTRVIEPRLAKIAINWADFTGFVAQDMRDDPENIVAKTIRDSISKAMDTHADMQRLQALPIIGTQISSHLESTIVDIVVDSIANMVKECTLPSSLKPLKQSIADADRQTHGAFRALDEHIVDLVIDILEITKEQVNTKRWKSELNSQNL